MQFVLMATFLDVTQPRWVVQEVTRYKANQNYCGPSSHHSSPVHFMFLSPPQKEAISSIHVLIDIIGPSVLLEYSVALMWLHQTYLLLYREIVLLVSGTLPTYPAGLFHITKCLSCFLYILRSYHTVYYLHRFLCIQFGECLSLCGLRHQYKLRRPQRFLLMEDLCRKKK